jgi:fatty acid desaturase
MGSIMGGDNLMRKSERSQTSILMQAFFRFRSWICTRAGLVTFAKMRKQEAAGLASYAAALTAVGLLMMLANCVLAIFQPRYTLPMLELTIVSMFILFGVMMESLFPSSRRLCGGETR